MIHHALLWTFDPYLFIMITRPLYLEDDATPAILSRDFIASRDCVVARCPQNMVMFLVVV